MSTRRPHAYLRGFTLLELLVVLALIAMMAGVAVPRMVRWMEGVQERGWRDDLKARIEHLPVRAFRAGQPLSIDGDALGEGLNGSPGGLVLRLREPLEYGAAGLARGGVVELLKNDEVAYRWRVLPVTGKVLEEQLP